MDKRQSMPAQRKNLRLKKQKFSLRRYAKHDYMNHWHIRFEEAFFWHSDSVFLTFEAFLHVLEA